jgi:hypothetical protein
LRSSITIVASPRPRVGKTLLARVLTDYLAQHARDPLGFDLGGGEGGLSDFLPQHAELASLGDVRAQMSFFDALIAIDGRPKILDLGADLFQQFFEQADHFALPQENAARGIDMTVMYIITPDRTSMDAARALLRRFPEMTLTPVHNEIFGPAPHRQIDSVRAREPLLKIPALSVSARKFVEAPPFSFADDRALAQLPPSVEADVDAWLRRMHRDLRALELRASTSQPQPVRIGS